VRFSYWVSYDELVAEGAKPLPCDCRGARPTLSPPKN
jgi:hypothetical protein